MTKMVKGLVIQPLLPMGKQVQAPPVFATDKYTHLTIYQACQDRDEISSATKLRLHFSFTSDNFRLCLPIRMRGTLLVHVLGSTPKTRLSALSTIYDVDVTDRNDDKL